MANKKGKNRLNRKNFRITLVFFAFILFVFYVIFKYANISIIKGEEYRKMALEQLTKSFRGNDNRGEILDDEGVRIAVNIPAFTIWANPKEYEENSAKTELAAKLAEILDMDTEDIKKSLNGERRSKIVQWASEDQVKKISEIEDLRGITLEEVQKRFYNDGVLFNHILGFTDIDQNGLSGVEMTFNEELKGEPERIVKKTDASNQELPFQNTIHYGGQNHGDVVLTINSKIQRIVQDEAIRTKEDNLAKSVSITVIDPMTGDILAMSDTNLFDPNDHRAPVDEKQAEEWKEKTPEEMPELWQQNWNNLNVNVLFEPGSTFKTVTLAAAIEEGVVDDSTDLYCGGAITDIPGVTLRCVRWQNPHGHLNMTEAFSESCNVAFIEIARKLGREKFLKYIRAFGFGEKSGVRLNAEQVGLIPNDLREMTAVRLATASYGQGIATTNLQMAMATAAAVNGGNLLTPRIVKEVRSGDTVIEKFPVEIRRKVISKYTSDKMREIMEYSVIHMNKRGAVPGYRVGGKSGTAQVAKNGKYIDGLYMSSFIGVAPIDDPKILVLVNVEEPGNGQSFGGAVAGPVSARIMEKVLPMLGVKPSGETVEVKTGVVAVPDIVGKPFAQATKALREVGLRYYIDEEELSEYSIVKEISIPAFTNVDRGTIIDIKLKKVDKKKFTPDFIGLSIVDAIKLAEEYDLDVSVNGEGKCVEQSIEAGSFLEEKKISLTFKE